jgi:hypothetical protein
MKNSISCITSLALLLRVSTSLATPLNAATSASPVFGQPKQHLRHTVNNKSRAVIEQPRIIGGTRVKIPYPFFALLEVGCGAILIHDDSKLTDANCILTEYWNRVVLFGQM